MNGSSEAALSEEGKKFNGGTIVETRRTTNRGMLLVVTTKPGSDNDRKALFRYSYMIGRNYFAIKKKFSWKVRRMVYSERIQLEPPGSLKRVTSIKVRSVYSGLFFRITSQTPLFNHGSSDVGDHLLTHSTRTR